MKSCSPLADMHRTDVLAVGAWTDQIQDKPELSVTRRVTRTNDEDASIINVTYPCYPPPPQPEYSPRGTTSVQPKPHRPPTFRRCFLTSIMILRQHVWPQALEFGTGHRHRIGGATRVGRAHGAEFHGRVQSERTSTPSMTIS